MGDSPGAVYVRQSSLNIGCQFGENVASFIEQKGWIDLPQKCYSWECAVAFAEKSRKQSPESKGNLVITPQDYLLSYATGLIKLFAPGFRHTRLIYLSVISMAWFTKSFCCFGFTGNSWTCIPKISRRSFSSYRTGFEFR